MQGSNKTVSKPMKELLGSNEKLVPSADCHDLTKLVYTHDAAVMRKAWAWRGCAR